MSCSENCCEGKKLKLIYFNGRGRGETIRWLLTYAKVPFEDFRMQPGTDDWPKTKPSTPIGQVPCLEVTDSDGSTCMMCQSSAILRSVAAWYGFAGCKPCETATADEIYECLRDVHDTGSKAMHEKEEARKDQLFEQLKCEIIPRNLAYVEKKVQANGGKNIAGGEKYTYADFALATLLEALQLIKGGEFWPAVEENYPGLVGLKKAIAESPDIKEYLAKRPETPF